MKVAIITGISGQDGAYLAKLLIKMDYKVIGTTRSYRNNNIYDNLKYLNILSKVQIIELDLTDIANIILLIKKHEPQEIYNLAAQSSVGISYMQPIGTFSFNTTSVNNLLEAIRTIDPRIKFYQASSSEMYGEVKNLPINKGTKMHPVSPYGVSKMAAHYMAITYRDSYNLFVCSGILFNHESYLRSNNFFVKKIIVESIRIKNRLQKELKVGNLNIRRDFGYAPKYVEAMYLIMQQENARDYIICSGESILLRDIVEYVFKKLNLDLKRIIVDEKLFRPNEIFEIYGDNLEAKDLLNWNYSFSFYDILDVLIEEELKALNVKL